MTRAADVSPLVTVCARVRRFRSLLDAIAVAPLGLVLLVAVFAGLVSYRASIDRPIPPNDALVIVILFAEAFLIAGAILALVLRRGVRRGDGGPTVAAALLLAVPGALFSFTAACTSLWVGAADALGDRRDPFAIDDVIMVSGLWFGVLATYLAVTALLACGASSRLTRWRTDAPALAEACDYVLGPGSRGPRLRPHGPAALALAAAGWLLSVLAVVAFFVFGVAEAIFQSAYLLSARPLAFDDVYSFLWSFSPVNHSLSPFFAFLALGFVAQFLLERAARLRAPLANQAQENDPRPPVLVLRSFRAEHLALDRMMEVSTVIGQLRATRQRTLEETVVDATASYGPALAIGRPGDALPPLGAARLYVGESGDWQAQVREWIARCRMVVAMLGGSEGLHWEFRAVREGNALEKVLVVCPPSTRDELAANWVKVGAQVADAPPDDRAAPWLRRRERWPLAVVRFGAPDALTFTAPTRNEAAFALATKLAAAYLADPAVVEGQLRVLDGRRSVIPSGAPNGRAVEGPP